MRYSRLGGDQPLTVYANIGTGIAAAILLSAWSNVHQGEHRLQRKLWSLGGGEMSIYSTAGDNPRDDFSFLLSLHQPQNCRSRCCLLRHGWQPAARAFFIYCPVPCVLGIAVSGVLVVIYAGQLRPSKPSRESSVSRPLSITAAGGKANGSDNERIGHLILIWQTLFYPIASLRIPRSTAFLHPMSPTPHKKLCAAAVASPELARTPGITLHVPDIIPKPEITKKYGKRKNGQFNGRRY